LSAASLQRSIFPSKRGLGCRGLRANPRENAMRLKVTSSKVVLNPGQVLTIDDAKGVHIRPVGARVWVTEEGDCSDFVVNPGEEFVVSCKGRTVVQAIDTTWVDLQEAA
jgi:hypothetical protein